MKNLSASLAAHYALPERTIAAFWLVQRTDGVVFGFTDHDQPRVIDGVTYEAFSGFTGSQVATNSQLSVDNMEVTGLFDSSGLTDAQLEAGVWDNSEIEYFEANYMDLTMGRNPLMAGWLGHVKRNGGMFVAELRSLTSLVQKAVGDVLTPNCRYKLGDLNCKVDLAAITEYDVPVTSVTSRLVIIASSLIVDTRQFNWGVLRFTTGLNAGFAQDIKSFNSATGAITLQLTFPYAVSVADEFTIEPGCNKLLKTATGYDGDCKTIYNNVINFGGEPEIPMASRSYRLPGG